MNTKQIRDFFYNKCNNDCSLTDKLIRAGYQQPTGGYIKNAITQNIEVNYKNAKPTQHWHLIESYCNNTKDDVKFTKKIQCGELIFWMAEVSGSVKKNELEELLTRIIESGTLVQRRNTNKPNVKYCRSQWNREIQRLCFDKIVEKVESYTTIL